MSGCSRRWSRFTFSVDTHASADAWMWPAVEEASDALAGADSVLCALGEEEIGQEGAEFVPSSSRPTSPMRFECDPAAGLT